MALERTLSIVKPDAVAKNVIGEIYSRFERPASRSSPRKCSNFEAAGSRRLLRRARERPFFNALVNFMISGPVMVQVLEGDNAVLKNRELMGATNPKEAAAGTDPRRFRRQHRRETRCTVRTRWRTRRSRSPTSSGHRRLRRPLMGDARPAIDLVPAGGVAVPRAIPPRGPARASLGRLGKNEHLRFRPLRSSASSRKTWGEEVPAHR